MRRFDLVPTAMVIVLSFEVGANTIIKAGISSGMINFVFVVYMNAFSIPVLLLACFIVYRKKKIPPLTTSIVGKIFLLSMLSCALQIFNFFGMEYSSPTLASAILDLTPAFTFILAIISGMEKLNLRAQSSLAKCFGTMVSIIGALVVTLYKGVPFTSVLSLKFNGQPNEVLLLSQQSNWVFGGLLLSFAALSFAVILIVQTWIMRDFPAELVIALIGNCFLTILTSLAALIKEKDLHAWRITGYYELMAVVCSAVGVVCARNVVNTWACGKKGPVYVSMFNPLMMLIAVVMGVTFLGETLYLGSVIGGTVIALGFYAVIWGTAQEEKAIEDERKYSLDSSSPRAPLLADKGLNGVT